MKTVKRAISNRKCRCGHSPFLHDKADIALTEDELGRCHGTKCGCQGFFHAPKEKQKVVV